MCVYMYIYIYVSICIWLYTYTYVYIYIYIERERDIHVCIHTHTSRVQSLRAADVERRQQTGRGGEPRPTAAPRRRAPSCTCRVRYIEV